jgi:hypothetical protein
MAHRAVGEFEYTLGYSRTSQKVPRENEEGQGKEGEGIQPGSKPPGDIRNRVESPQNQIKNSSENKGKGYRYFKENGDKNKDQQKSKIHLFTPVI